MTKIFRTIAYSAALMWLGSSPFASSVASVSVTELTDQSEAIFEGSVVALKNVAGAGKGNVHTLVTFEVLDMIKGNPQVTSVELSYLGGKTADGLVMIITDMNLPTLGEHGIYFVEQMNGKLVHPLSGWDQGHFLVKAPLSGVHQGYVTTHDGASIYDVNVSQLASTKGLSSGKAAGIVVSPLAEDAVPVTTADFKEMIRGMVQ